MATPSDGYVAMIVFGLSVVASEVLIAGSRWRPTLGNRLRLALPIWAVIMGAYIVFRMVTDWGAI